MTPPDIKINKKSARVHLLPDDLVARIAAGEVVERPSSVLKELIENSLDAGSTDITIVIEGAGRTLIQISDNGIGMSPEDAKLALKRHATSKISQFEDLELINTFGFRGEALPSIAAVSKFTLTTRSDDNVAAWEIAMDGGKIRHEKPAARERGTTISVQNLFFNTPARFKFLKSDPTERSQCLRVIEEMAFVSPGVRFHVTIEKAKPLLFQESFYETKEDRISAVRERVIQAWGPKWAKGMDAVYSSTPHFTVLGLVSNQGAHQATPRNQYLFINHRPVIHRRLTRAVYDAFLGQLPQARHPAWVLFIDVNPQTIDVNVHPSKREVKLAHESEIYGFLVNAIRSSLHTTTSIPVDLSQHASSGSLSAPSHPYSFTERRAHPRSSPERKESLLNSSLDSLYRATERPTQAGPFLHPFQLTAGGSLFDQGQTEFLGLKQQQIQAVAQIRNTFIVAQTDDGIMIVDQHAAAEKVMYEELLNNMSKETPTIQMMLVPFQWEVALSLRPLITEKLPLMQKMGFVLEPFGGETFLVKGYPSVMGERFDLHSLLDGISDIMGESSDRKGGFERNFEHRLAAMTACKASVKAGDPLDLKSCQFILQALIQCDAPLTCPHGRPTVIRLSYSELERRFRRT